MRKGEFGEYQRPSSGGILTEGIAKDLFRGTAPEISAYSRCPVTPVTPDPKTFRIFFPHYSGKDGDLKQDKTENSGSSVALPPAPAFPFPLKYQLEA